MESTKREKREKYHLAYGPQLLAASITAVSAVLIAMYITTVDSDEGGTSSPPTESAATATALTPDPPPSTNTAGPSQLANIAQALTLDAAAEANNCDNPGGSGRSWDEINPSFLGQSYAEGFSCGFAYESPIEGSVEYLVGAEKTRFQAIGGIDDSSENTSPQVRFTVYNGANGEVLQSFDANYENPVSFDVNIEGVPRLGLRVESLSAEESLWDASAVIAWAEPTVE